MTTRDQYALVCQNICYLRKKHGLSRTAMARKLQISIKTLDLLEGGTFPERIHIGFFFHVQQAFGIPPTQMLTRHLPEV